MVRPTFREFTALARDYTVVPVARRLASDLLTPLGVYQRLRGRFPYSFLLESVPAPNEAGRYSFIGADASAVLTALDYQRTRVVDEQGVRTLKKPFFEVERDYLARYRAPTLPDLPPLNSGLVGWYGYDCVGFYERFRREAKDDLGLPLAQALLLRDLVAFDNVKGQVVLISNVFLEKGQTASLKESYAAAQKRLQALEDALRAPVGAPAKKMHPKPPPLPKSNMTPKAFESMVKKAKEYIRIGDIFQVVLSQRYATTLHVAPLEVYRALRMLNPSPYLFFLDFKEVTLIGSSPEILVTVNGDTCRTRPLAGTRPRGSNREEDLALEKDLLADKKEIAEHVMLVDLGRNDLGRVSRYGTVKVNELMKVERYSHVMHIASDVTGEKRDDKDVLDVLTAVMPAGTLSGAPKVRAMEIIDELEPNRRGAYGGCVGYVGFNGEMDTCITLRTIVCKGKTAWLQAGAGIVADSDPATEFNETRHKLGALFRAIELAHQREMFL